MHRVIVCMKISFWLFLLIAHWCGVPASLAAQHVMCVFFKFHHNHINFVLRVYISHKISFGFYRESSIIIKGCVILYCVNHLANCNGTYLSDGVLCNR